MGLATVEHNPIQLQPLHLARSIESLQELVKEDTTVSGLKHNIHRLPPVLGKLKRKILNEVHDQELCFLLCKRYIIIVELLQRFHGDPNYIHAMFSYDLEVVKKLLNEVTVKLTERYLVHFDDTESSVSFVTAGALGDQLPTSEGSFPGSFSSSDNSEPTNETSRDIFQILFIKPAHLYETIEDNIQLLLIDIRLSSDFDECHILLTTGHVINIPYTIIIPGDTANTLGMKLNQETQLIWAKRDKFEAIVLLDNHTQKYDYQGSKLELLRSCLVEWDINMHYKCKPVILNGGIKEFIQWYPSQVTNRGAYLSRNCNLEIDELLDIEQIEYPEPGSTLGPNNVKLYSTDSTGLLKYRIKRDFVNDEADKISVTRSECKVSSVYFEIQEHFPGALESLSDSALLPPHRGETEPSKKHRLDAEFKDVILGDRDTLLKKARAVKPKPAETNTMAIENKTDDIIAEEVGRSFAEVKIPDDLKIDLTEEPPAQVDIPIVDRSQKPKEVTKFECPGEGFTVLRNYRNICYMNAMLQSLKVIPVLKHFYVTTNLYAFHTRRDPPVVNEEFARAMISLWRGHKATPRTYYLGDLKASMVAVNPVYDNGHHEDTFEFFIDLFTHIAADCEYSIPRPPVMTESERAWFAYLQGRSSFYHDLFFYQTKNSRTCRKCRKVNVSYDVEGMVMLPLPERESSLETLINDYMKDSTIPDFACTKCKTIGSLIHHKEIRAPPDILTIVLKRYRVDNNGIISKNKNNVTFPKDNLNFCNAFYKLYAIPQHVGTTNSGHYFTTVLLDDMKDEWYTFNDDHFLSADSNLLANKDITKKCVGFFYVKKQNCDNRCRL